MERMEIFSMLKSSDLHVSPFIYIFSNLFSQPFCFCFGIRVLYVLLYLCAQVLNHVWLFLTPWTAACQAPLSMEFSRQEHRSRLPFPTPGDLPNSGIQPESPTSPAWAGGFFTTEPPGKLIIPLLKYCFEWL